MSFEARYVDLHVRAGFAEHVVAVWCELNGRFRRFTADNVKDLQDAGHDFHFDDVDGARHAICVVGASPHAHLHTNATGIERNILAELPDWGLHGHSSGHSTHPPPAVR